MTGVGLREDGLARERGVDTGTLGMRILLASLSMLFASTITGYAVIRSRAAAWPPPGVPSLPAGLWLSTALLVASSFTMYVALSGIRQGRQKALRTWLMLTFALGVAFLLSQTASWFVLVAERMTAKTNLYAFMFYLLTGLHAAHVVGGLIPLGFTVARAWKGSYTATSHAGVDHVSVYWHFLGVVWLILFVVLMR